MKVLLIKPMEHPQVVDIENSLKEFFKGACWEFTHHNLYTVCGSQPNVGFSNCTNITLETNLPIFNLSIIT